MDMIQDGTGTGTLAEVTAKNKLAVDSVARTNIQQAIQDSDGYNIASTKVTLTDTSESAVFYLKNNEENDLIITSVFVNTSASTGTLSGQPEFRVYRNPTGGTIVSSGTAATETNQNYGSNKTLVADSFTGAEGKTLTGHTDTVDVPLPSRAAVTLIEFSTLVVLPRGASYGLTYKPQTGSTSVDLIMGVTVILT